jgi:hypothetical protein
MRKLLPLIAMVFSLVAVSPAVAGYRLINCNGSQGQDHVAVTPRAPGCNFGKAAYRPLLRFANGGRSRGTAVVRFRHTPYFLACHLASGGLLVQCGVEGKPWVRLYLDSASAPPGYPWPTHT